MSELIRAGAVPGDLTIALAMVALCAVLSLATHRLWTRVRRAAPSGFQSQEADLSFEGLFFVERGVIYDVNMALCSMLGRARDEIIGSSLAAFFTPESYTDLQRVVHDRAGVIDGELVTADGTQKDVDIAVRAPSADRNTVSVVAVRDITERKKAERKNQLVVLTDPLTCVGNRTLFHERLRQGIEWAQRTKTSLGVFSVGVDRLKAINEQMGHTVGCGLLIEVADRLCDGTRQIDTVARMGDDEFAVIATLIRRPEDVLMMAQRLLAALNKPYNIEGYLPDTRISIGIALYPNDTARSESLLKFAEVGLVRAKHDGGGQLRFFSPDMDTKLQARRALEKDLRQALDRREIAVHYMGIFDAASQEMRGAEAFLRWQHAERGYVPPPEFIGLAEDCGLIHAMGDWMLETACARAALWPASTSMAVNISTVQIMSPDFSGRVLKILSRTGLAPERLELEIAEGMLIDESEKVLEVLRALKTHGIRITLDDFGTGFSSLGHLHRFPFDSIKIDRSVIGGLGVKPEADINVRTILAVGKTLSLNVVAEGVETPAQLALLADLGCGKVQGYLFGRPVPGDECQFAPRTQPAAA